jgi:uncharacterized protein YktB (UPF0637 family)
MPANTRSKPIRPSSDVVLLDSDTLAIKRNNKQNTKKPARKENCPINSGEIIEISSDEDEGPVAPRSVVTTSKLQERIRQLETVRRSEVLGSIVYLIPQENARIKKENDEIKKQKTVVSSI